MKKIPFRNHSPHGWWIASYIERPQWDDEPKPSNDTRCKAWENTIILKAKDREAAYKKVLRLTKSRSDFGDAKGRRTGRWVFEGITSLLPIYDELTDGAEVLWIEYRNRKYKTIKSWTKQKMELEVFDDTLAVGDFAD